MKPLTIDLDRIANELAGVVTLGGKQHTVKPVSAASLQLMRSAEPQNYLDISMTIVARCVPSLTDEQRTELCSSQIEAILAVATGDVDAVAKLDPNGDGPAMPSISPV